MYLADICGGQGFIPSSFLGNPFILTLSPNRLCRLESNEYSKFGKYIILRCVEEPYTKYINQLSKLFYFKRKFPNAFERLKLLQSHIGTQ